MPLKFRLKGLAETFIERLRCTKCGHDGGDSGDDNFRTDLSKVTYDGIIVVIQCLLCNNVFVPENQRLGILDSRKLRKAVEKDSTQSGEPLLKNIDSVRLDVEKLNASRNNNVH